MDITLQFQLRPRRFYEPAHTFPKRPIPYKTGPVPLLELQKTN
jgi:hypothetical protein